MKIFLDTCALFKLYHNETDSQQFEEIFTENIISGIFLSELTKLEFSSTLWKKVRTKEITKLQAEHTIAAFSNDLKRYDFIPIDSLIINSAVNLLKKYGKDGLRTLDSIQFSTALLLKKDAQLFVTADKLLSSFFKAEKL